ncbi:DUF222 domain-containing protein [Kribbella sp. NBC_00889]|uniref:HNH endonuclease signature motif containing protein n=1 Tax=Kribbella sp. NBC_00889 TaxID=2975974 RepID=UPI0038671963|nr:DUF222 domain-containing protein [Kribbella sp. NBC_00889]
MELLDERPIWSMSGSEMLSALDAVDAELAQRQTYRLQLIAALDDIGHAHDIGAHDTVQLLAFRYRLDRPVAHRDVRLARALPKYRTVSAALTDDAIPATSDPDNGGQVLHPAQAEAIVSALERVPATVPVEDVEVAEQQLVNLARHLNPGELRKAGKQVRDLLDTDGPEPDEHKAYARESLALITAENGVKFRGYLANENAELLRSLIHAGARPHKTLDGELDPRPRDKRQADALTTALTLAAKSTDPALNLPTTKPGPTTPAALASQSSRAASGAGAAGVRPAAVAAATAAARGDIFSPDTGPAYPALGEAASGPAPAGAVPGFGAKANITVTIDLEDLKSAAAEATGGLVYGDNLSAAAIRRLACDANIIPLVLGSNSEPLDVGRSERLVTRAMRRALNARDKGCVVCGAPPIHCDAHHLRSWLDGGETAIWNLVLVCRRHHIDLHAGHWTITITNGKVHVTRPTWADPPPAPDQRQCKPAPPSPTTRPRSSTPPNPQVKPLRGRLPDDGSRVDPWSGGRLSDGLRSDDAERVDSAQSREGRVGDTSRVTTCSGNLRTDAAALREAARQAIWGDTPTSDPGTRTALPGPTAVSAQSAHHDPWPEPGPPAAVRPRGT